MSDGIRWQRDPRACSHSNDDVCQTCDFDGYYARTYPGCPWRESAVAASEQGAPE
jgi:hypothetical protein